MGIADFANTKSMGKGNLWAYITCERNQLWGPNLDASIIAITIITFQSTSPIVFRTPELVNLSYTLRAVLPVNLTNLANGHFSTKSSTR